METIRTFLALDISSELTGALFNVQKKLIKNTTGVKWVKPENIHLTLKFLGAIQKKRVEVVCSVIGQIASEFALFNFTVGGLGAFPSSRNPKVIWAGINPNKNLIVLRDKIESVLLSVGVPKEKRPFSPHLTIGRLKDSKGKNSLRQVLDELKHEQLGTFETSRIVFYKSDLLPTGSVHYILKKVDFFT